MNKNQLTTAVLREIAIIHEKMDTHLKQKLPVNLPPSQFKLLNHLIYSTNTNESSSELAALFHVSLSAMSQIVKQLIHKGYVSLQVRDHDARQKKIIITEQGRLAHEHATGLIYFDLNRFASKFNQADMQQLFSLIHHFRLEFEK
ncbi:MarR family transcriptional regulator [Psychromonas sp. MME2]|uniref:MarR family winged helix-turn-helix transcriptional regulator n=1 Tax=unclassified Psychromonas TaxID=2614957 RepID=UPI00339C35E6